MEIDKPYQVTLRYKAIKLKPELDVYQSCIIYGSSANAINRDLQMFLNERTEVYRIYEETSIEGV